MKKEFKEIPKKEEEMGITATYSTVDEWRETFENFKKGGATRVYERGGYPELKEREEKIADLIGMEKDEVVLFNSGMASISAALESQGLTKGDVILYSPDLYLHSKRYVEEDLKERGVKIIPINFGNIKEVEEAIDKHKPHVIFTEIVGNAENMPVVDVDRLIGKTEETNKKYREEFSFESRLRKIIDRKEWFYKEFVDINELAETGRQIDQKHSNMPLRSLVRDIEDNIVQKSKSAGDPISEEKRKKNISSMRRELFLELKSSLNTAWLHKREKPMTLILDNTISTSTNLKLAPKLEKTEAPIVVVESGTKFYAHDKGTLGIAYSKNPEKKLELKLKRTRMGSYLPSAVEKLLPEFDKEKFGVRNEQVLKNTKYLAETLAKLTGEIGIETVSHPNLPTHPNYEQVSKEMPDGASAIFYVGCEDSFETAKELKKALSDRTDIGVSFGFDKMRILPLPDGILRVAGGNENPEEMKEILEIIEKLNKEK